jgi:hypothetical protein
MIIAPAASLLARASALTTHRQIQFILICIVLLLATRSLAQEPPTQLSWTKQAEITTYRLQIANDERFTDVLFDGLVAVTKSQNGRLIIAGNDQTAVGLRALEVEKTRGNR